MGPPGRFDRIAAIQFGLLTACGLRDHHTLLDIGCGSLRAGRLLLAYLNPGNYYGIEPEEWVLAEGIAEQVGPEFIDLRRPTFSADPNFTLTTFGVEFDFLLAQSIFSHASPAQISRCLSQAAQVVKPTSKFLATYLQGDTDYPGDTWVYPGCVTYREETMRRFAQDNGFQMEALDWDHPSQRWVMFYPAGAARPEPPMSPAASHRRQQSLERRLATEQRRLATAQRRLDALQGRRTVRLENVARAAAKKLLRR